MVSESLELESSCSTCHIRLAEAITALTPSTRNRTRILGLCYLIYDVKSIIVPLDVDDPRK